MPHLTVDPVVIGAQIVVALQPLVSRGVDPTDSAVVSVTTFRGGTGHNVIPEAVELTGTVRTFRETTRARVETQLKKVARAVASAMGGAAEVTYSRGYPATVNDAREADEAAAVAAEVVGARNVSRDCEVTMGAEDFSYMLNERPGCYVWLGQGASPEESASGRDHSTMVHHPQYDFNDEVLPIGAEFFVRMVERKCARA
jgi:hippurate hydrolase